MISGGPYFVIPSRRGAVPSLTPTQAGHILREDERILSLSVFDAVGDYTNACAKLNVSFACFCGLPGYKLILTLRTSFFGQHQSAPSTDAGISGDHEKGRGTVSVAKWKEIVATLKPTLAVELSESIPLSEPVSKRRRTLTIRTANWEKKTRESSEKEGDGCIHLAPMLVSNGKGGFLDVFARNENLRELATGLHQLELLAPRPSFMYAYSVAAMLAGICAGVQLIESPLPWELAEKGVALTFPLEDQRVFAGDGQCEIDLNDDIYTLDIGPLCAGCDCYTCKRHNRAYIHHLLTVQEMNSNILLSIHNLHRVVQMFRRAREANGDRDALEHFSRIVLSAF